MAENAIDSRTVERDGLTGLFTRREFEDRLEASLIDAKEEGVAVSLLFLDIDQFKRVNGAHGHAIGDAVIGRVAESIRGLVTETAVPARYGGEEFAVVLPGVEREQAFLLGERLRASMDTTHQFHAEDHSVELKVTVSGGVSAFPTDGRTARDILRRADQALYRAKDTGRNKICIAEEERMAAKTSHYTLTQLSRLSRLANEEGVGEAVLLREALDDLLIKYKVSEIES